MSAPSGSTATLTAKVISNEPSSAWVVSLTERASRNRVSTRPAVLVSTVYHTVTVPAPLAAIPFTRPLSAVAPWVTPDPVMESMVRNDATGASRAARLKSSSTLELLVTVKSSL